MAALGTVGIGGLGLSRTSAAAISGGGPPDANDWHVVFEDDFEDGSLDTSNWSVGWGWGTQTTQGSMYTDERCINFGDSTLELGIRNEPSTYPVGAVNTKNKVTVGPGTYMEARTRAANLPGTTSNFWSKPNSEAWPPEIDIKETPIRDGDDANRSIHHIHWTTDGQPGGSHADMNLGSHGGFDHSTQWTVYGLRWLEDSVTYYVNGQEHARTDRSDVMESLNNGAPFYLMLDLMNWPGPDLHPDDFSGYKTVHEVDWIRVWEPGAGSGPTTTSTPTETATETQTETATETETQTETSTDAGEHYVWFRSASNGESVTFAFRASDGNIRIDSGGHEADYWVAPDGQTAGGTTDRFLRLPGFWYEGSITDLSYEGPLQVYVDNERVDPDSLVDESTPGPEEPDSGDSTSGTDETLPHTLTIDGRGYGGSASYSVTVSDRIVPTEQTDDEDSVSETTAEGSVGPWYDEYRFSGSITSISLEGDAAVHRDGNRVNLLRIERGPDSDGAVRYIVESTGRLLKADVDSASINSNDKVDGNRAFGSVVGGTDAYFVLDGDVTDVSTFGGSVTTTLDGEEVDLTR